MNKEKILQLLQEDLDRLNEYCSYSRDESSQYYFFQAEKIKRIIKDIKENYPETVK